MAKFFAWIDRVETFLSNIFPRPAYEQDPAELPMNTQPPAPLPVPVPPAQLAPHVSLLIQFCAAIRDYEGSPGDLNYLNNNPGNCRCSSVGYLPKYGNVLCVPTKSGYFAKFPTYELGWEYLQALVTQKVKQNPIWTIQDFMRHYSPVEDDNNPDTYAVYIAKRLHVSVSYPMTSVI